MRDQALIQDLINQTPQDDAFYTTPDLPPGGTNGDPIYLRPLTNTLSVPEGGENWLLLYRSETAGQNPAAVATSGIVVLPDAAAHPVPDGGYPLVSWCHGTVGVANRVSPSRDTGDTGASAMNAYPTALLGRFLDQGWAVAMTDYEALGTGTDEKLHPYLLGQSEARAALDIVLAARKVFGDEISGQFALVGHSQGGQAALFAAANAEGRVDGLLAVAAIAPANHALNVVQAGALNPGIDEGYAFTPLFLAGAIGGSIVDANDGDEDSIKVIDPQQVLSDRGYAFWPQLLDLSRAELSDKELYGGVPGNQQFRKRNLLGYLGDPNDDQREFNRQLAKMNPDLAIPVPVRISQAEADQRVRYEIEPLALGVPGTKVLITELKDRNGEEAIKTEIYDKKQVSEDAEPLGAHFTTINVDAEALIGWLIDHGLATS
jgi:pimeloyl-ACP methyl ester carboxylesterase